MANRPKIERNQKIWDYWERGYRQKSIANMFKMKEAAVSMVIARERKRRASEPDLPKKPPNQNLGG